MIVSAHFLHTESSEVLIKSLDLMGARFTGSGGPGGFDPQRN